MSFVEKIFSLSKSLHFKRGEQGGAGQLEERKKYFDFLNFVKAFLDIFSFTQNSDRLDNVVIH